MKNNARQRWHMVYTAKVENWADGIAWCVEFYGTLTEAINYLYKTEKVVELIDCYVI